jgi:hypothetical protein
MAWRSDVSNKRVIFRLDACSPLADAQQRGLSLAKRWAGRFQRALAFAGTSRIGADMLPKFVRFNDLKSRGIVNSWPQLRNLQTKKDFPSGRLIGDNSRAWTEDEVSIWLETRPTEPVAPKGAAKKARAA